MQWSLKKLLVSISVVAYLIAGTVTFGIAVTVTAFTIACVGMFVYSRFVANRHRVTRTAFVLGTVLVLYVAAFATFHVVRTFSFSLASHGDTWENIVVFSFDPNAQQIARNLYYPMIAITSDHYAYPNEQELRKLMEAAPMGRYGYFW